MKNSPFIVFLFIFIACFLGSCDLEKYITSDLGKNSATLDSTTFSGIVIDKFSEKPISGAEVWVTGYQTFTEERGGYTLKIPFYSDYNRNASVILSAKAKNYGKEFMLIFPEPVEMKQNFELIYLPPIIDGFFLEWHSEQNNSYAITSTIITDYQGHEDISSVLAAVWVIEDNKSVRQDIPLQKSSVLSAYSAMFTSDRIFSPIDTQHFGAFVYAYDFGGNADTAYYPPGFY